MNRRIRQWGIAAVTVLIWVSIVHALESVPSSVYTPEERGPIQRSVATLALPHN